jgi:peptidoglycan/LPS O-acetylase OafA/YrhL
MSRRRFTVHRHRQLAIALLLVLAPGAARANLSHLAPTGVVALLLVVALFAFGPPVVAAIVAPKGQRMIRCFVAFVAWIALLVLTAHLYNLVPQRISNPWSTYAVLAALGLLAVAFACGIVIHQRLSSRPPQQTRGELK